MTEVAAEVPTPLAIAGCQVAELHDGTGMARHLSPRPYVTARTLQGREVTDVNPADHRHHAGVSLAPADVDGVSFWGGRTYVRDVGSKMLDNHGSQQLLTRRTDASGAWEQLAWLAPDGTRLATEERALAAVALHGPREGWVLRWRSRLLPERPLTIGSPATNGRAGAWYGGWFWRTPWSSGADVFTDDAEGEGGAHGSRSWSLALSGPDASLVAVQRERVRPWFVRAGDYTGFGPALAHTERLAVTPDEPLTVALDVAVVDGAVSRRDVLGVLRGLDELAPLRAAVPTGAGA